MGRRITKRKTLTTVVKTVEIDGKKYIELDESATMQDYQNAVINSALNENNFHPTATADSLGMGKSTVYRMLNSDTPTPKEDNKKKKK
ncbi:MAG: hypothetical protein P8J32_01890 [bacterium]|nr:hypothetical protein [bacterium]